MEPVERDRSQVSELQAGLDAFLERHQGIAELRAQWITILTENPEARWEAVRALDRHRLTGELESEHFATLKRIVDTFGRDTSDDATVVLEDEDDTVLIGATKRDDASEEPAPDTPAPGDAFGIDLSEAVNQIGQSATPEVSLGDTLKPGFVLKSRFVLEEPLGRGGMGVVYKARDLLRQRVDVAASHVALKVLREEFRRHPQSLKALQHEAYQAQVLSHPNIVSVYDFDHDADTFFLTMELLEGELLRSVFSRLHPETIPLERALRIVAGMCRGLAHAHARGLVHSDFKPGNVFLTADDEPKILDFGIARVAVPDAETGDTVPKITGADLRAITPAYASCEMLEGAAPDFRDDVYSLSCVIYELLAGRHPFDKKSALVARDRNLRPEPIVCLTDPQWQTLAAGLDVSRDKRSATVRDLLTAFTARTVVTPPPTVIVKKPSGIRSTVYLTVGVILGAGTVLLPGTREIDIGGSRISDPPAVESATPAETGSTPAADPLSRSIVDSPVTEPDVSAAPGTDPGESVSQEPPPVVATAESVTSPTDAAAGLAVEITPVAADPDTEASIANTSPAAAEPEATTMLTELPAQPPVDAADTSAVVDAAVPGFRLGAAEYSIRESANALAVRITRQGDLSIQASVAWTTFEGSADPYRDYVSSDWSPVQFAAGEHTKIIFVPIVSDSIAEPDEVFHVTLSNPSDNLSLADPATATVTIVDDDG